MRVAVTVPSKQTLRWPPAPTGRAPVFYCNANADDHLRLTVLIAHALRTRASAEAFTTAITPQSSWSERRHALADIISSARSTSRTDYVAVLVDPDALPVAPPTRSAVWDEATFERERRELLDLLLDAVDGGGWLLVRPAASSALSERLVDIALLDDLDDARVTSDVETLAPLAALLAGRMHERGELRDVALTRWRAQERATPLVVEEGLARLTPRARSTLVKLSSERRPMTLNGHCGAFEWSHSDPGETSVDRAEVEDLIGRGWVSPTNVVSGEFWIPPVVRAAATAGQGVANARAQHRVLASLLVADDPETLIERHWHALLAGERTLAYETGRFYASDLRELARAFSADGRFLESADVYRHIVGIDGADAYAWEYLAFNLVRTGASASRTHSVEIEAAYARAHALAPGNPLFHGRLLGFQVQQREIPSAHIERVCADYHRLHGQEAVEWFGWQVVQGLRRAGRRVEADDLSSRWRIAAPAQRLPRRFGSGPRGVVLATDFDQPLSDFDSPSEP